jgi:hypothetical protein
MNVKVWLRAAFTTVAFAGSLVLTGCGGSTPVPDASSTANSTSSTAPAAASSVSPGVDADAAARVPVDNYLSAMKAKDVGKGREQLCASLQAGFDKAATGPNGDFADHFVVNQAQVDKVEQAGNDRKVTATITAAPKSGGSSQTISVRFTVQSVSSSWCISNEALGS